MSNLERTNKITEALKLSVRLNYNKAVWFCDENTVSDYMNRKESFLYLKNINEAFLKIENTKRVVNSVIKKIKSLGFSINLIDEKCTNFGLIYYSATIKKHSK